MSILVEPADGRELDRLITVLLNLTGLVARVIDDARGSGREGVAVVDHAAETLRPPLAIVAEQYDDEELAFVVEILALGTLVTADALGLADAYEL
jgi:hypothetical protein